MTITVSLSADGISDAIRDLQYAKDNLQWGIEETLEILAKDGADIAQIADGSMAYVLGYLENGNTAKIQATGEQLLIAEFGAGDATELPIAMFENDTETDVYPGSYSEQVGSGEYAATGQWHFGGRVYKQVAPRMGLYKALQYIVRESTNITEGVIKL